MCFCGESEIDDFYFFLVFVFEHDVFQFQVSMAHSLHVQIMHGEENGMQNLGSLLFSKTLQIWQQITEISSLTVFHDQMKLEFILEDFIEFDDIGMIKILHNYQLLHKLIFIVFVAVLIDGFNGDC